MHCARSVSFGSALDGTLASAHQSSGENDSMCVVSFFELMIDVPNMNCMRRVLLGIETNVALFT